MARGLLRVAVVFAAGAGTPLHAQDAATPAEAAAPAAAPVQEIKEVIVTAQKTRQTLEQVPASVTSIDGDFIREIGVRDFKDLQAYAANTNIQLSPSSSQLLLRGLGTLNSVPGLDPSVGVVVDGVVYTYPSYLTAFFADLERFEVLRGPQGTLFGKNTSAGLLNVTTAAPVFDTTLFKWSLTARSSGDRSFQPVINLPLGPNLAVRFAGNVAHGDNGTFYNTLLKRPEDNPQQDSGRMRIRFDSHEGWTADVGYFFSRQQKNFNIQQLTIAGQAMQDLDRQYDPQFNTRLDNLVSENVKAKELSTIRGADVTLDFDLGHPIGLKSLKMTSVTGLAENVIDARDLDGDFSPVPFIRDSLYEPEPARQLVQELRFAGSAPELFGLGHDINFVTGLYYDNYTLKTSDNFIVEDLGAAAAYESAVRAGGIPGTFDYGAGQTLDQIINLLRLAMNDPNYMAQSAQSGLSQRTRDYAYYGQFEWRVISDFSMIGGLRYGKENRSADAFSMSNSQIIKALANQQDFSQHLRRTESDFSPKAGLKWQPNKRTEAYFTWARGYKSGGYNGIPLNPSNIEYGPERATSYEAGFKFHTRLLGGPLRDSISIYNTDIKNLQVSTFQGTNVIVVNAASALSRGIENDLLWLLPIRGLRLYTSVGFSDAHYLSYPNGQEAGDGACAGTITQPATATNSGSVCDLTGKRLPFAPKWTGSFVPSYTLHLPYAVDATTAVDVLYQGSRYLNSEDDVRELQGSTVTLNARLVLADQLGDDWSLTFAANNLTEQTTLDQVIDQPLAPGNFAAIRTDRGRYYQANLTISIR